MYCLHQQVLYAPTSIVCTNTYCLHQHVLFAPNKYCLHQTRIVCTKHVLLAPNKYCLHQTRTVSTKHVLFAPNTHCLHQTCIVYTKEVQQFSDRQRFSERSHCHQFRECSTVRAPGDWTVILWARDTVLLTFRTNVVPSKRIWTGVMRVTTKTLFEAASVQAENRSSVLRCT